MDLDAVTDELYALPRDEFIATRDERARQARSEGDRELAAEIGRLRKPSTAAWLANLLAREQPDEIRGLVELGEALRRAHSELDGETLRRLSGQRRELVTALAGQARALGRSAGQRISEGVSRELEDTFTAALADPDAARVLAAGRLTSGLQPGGGDGFGWPSGSSPQPGADRGAQRRERTDVDRRQGRPQQQRRQRQEQDRLRRDLDAARAAVADAEAAVAHAADELARAERAEDEATAAVADRRAELQTAERAAQQAAEETTAARRSQQAAERQARQARQRADELDRRLERLRDG